MRFFDCINNFEQAKYKIERSGFNHLIFQKREQYYRSIVKKIA